MTSLQKVVKYLALALAIFLCVTIIGSICTAIASFGFLLNHKELSVTASESESYALTESAGTLRIDLNAAQMTVRAGEGFHVESTIPDLIVEEKDGCLTITEPDSVKIYRSDNVTVDVTIPEGIVFETADIDTGAGKVDIDALAADEIQLDLGAGMVTIGSLIANERAQINGGAGKVEILNGELHDLDLNIAVGKLDMTARLTGSCDVDSGIGQTTLFLLGTQDDYEIHFDKGIGSATLDGVPMADDAVYGDGDTEIDIDGGVGQLVIRFPSANA